ncbi:MAG: metallophosphoesterase [Verrucomicrobia bacterium]|nr:metallophosphoesterase [Verrucomicrobiota bacterium]
MKRMIIIRLAGFCVAVVMGAYTALAEPIQGCVFVDSNKNGAQDAGERGLEGVPVTDGVQFVVTDTDGGFAIEPRAPAELCDGGEVIVSISVPDNYKPVSEWFAGLPADKADERLEFGLYPNDQAGAFYFVHGTDPHVPRGGKELFKIFKSELQKLNRVARFCILTGDLVDLGDSDPYEEAISDYELLSQHIVDFPMPLYAVPGNHDIIGVRADYTKADKPLYGYSAFTRKVGPLRWSFNYGGVHFVGIDFNTHTEEGKWEWGVPQGAVDWLKKDLEFVPDDFRIFLFVHSPEPLDSIRRVVEELGIDRVFCGHNHRDMVFNRAGAGVLFSGSLSQIFEDKDRRPGYRLVRVDPNGEIDSMYRELGRETPITVEQPRWNTILKSGDTIRGKVYDPEQKTDRVSIRLGDMEKQARLNRGRLWCSFEAAFDIPAEMTGAETLEALVVCGDRREKYSREFMVEGANAKLLSEFNSAEAMDGIRKDDAQVEWSALGKIQVDTGHEQSWPGITLEAPDANWDLSDFYYIAFEVFNPEDEPVKVFCRVDNPGADGTENCVTESVTIPAESSGLLQVDMSSTPWRLSEPLNLIGMRGNPEHPDKIDPSNINQILIFLHNPKRDHRLEIGSIYAAGEAVTLEADTFVPFVDKFGQFMHAEWSGKVHNLKELQHRRESERAEFAERPGPEDWNRFGGWLGGPRFKPTGFFRVEKVNGKWWFVDPEGRLFWSHGIDCVNGYASTPITDREEYFKFLPETGDPLSQFYGTGSWAPHGYYKGHDRYKTYDFAAANLMRKYGEGWRSEHAALAHKRLRSWAMNTIGNWSDASIYRMRRTPYVATIGFSSPVIEGSKGYWGKFPDPFHPEFREAARARIERWAETSVGDPWCLGIFVHNELAWGDETSLAVAALESPPEQPAKKAFIAFLKNRYGDIEDMNKAWKTGYESWNAFSESTQPPEVEKGYEPEDWDDAPLAVAQAYKQRDTNPLYEDMNAFYLAIAERYFSVIRGELKRAAPNHLYLGCRFAWANESAVHAAAEYCDVIGFNWYRYSVEQLDLPSEIDKPIIIGEFHFGALDRGMFHTGLCETRSQRDRAEHYKGYLESALRNPHVIGTHWFQFRDQALTGRGDGENYQIGFLDVCDTPYPETVKAARDVGEDMYRLRFSGDE